jgi:anti-sigma factor ChrR (cupin superfamily)
VPIVEISCVDVWREISNYVDGDVDPVLRVRIATHLKSCTHCSAVVDGTRNVIRLLGDGKSFDLPKGFSERLKQKLEKIGR